jgi:nucleotide-binding universal stress UspA family protein
MATWKRFLRIALLRRNDMGKKILCAVDDSDQTKSEVALAAQMAKALDAQLTLLAVNQLLGSYGGKGGISTFLWDDAGLKHVMDSALAVASKAGIADPKTATEKSRDVARAIVVYAEENGIDHIVVGTGGKSKLSRMMIGSVSRDVIDRAHCPVTVAR